MNITFTVFRIEVASIEVDLRPVVSLFQNETPAISAVETVVDGMSHWWVDKMLKRRRR